MLDHALKYHTEFDKILRDYTIGEEVASVLKKMRLVVLLAPSSTGRNTIIRNLMKTGDYHFIVSDTTRPPRINDGVPEQNGREYWFKSEEEVLDGLRNHRYLEAEILHNQQVSGINLSELSRAVQENKIAITDVDIKGVHNIMKIKPDTTAIMLLPPSFEEWQRRIAQRGKMSPQEQSRRLETAYKILEEGSEQHFYRYVIAENLEQSAAIVDSIGRGGPNPHQDRGIELIHRLQDEFSHHLNLR